MKLWRSRSRAKDKKVGAVFVVIKRANSYRSGGFKPTAKEMISAVQFISKKSPSVRDGMKRHGEQ